jgi:hypothetical protein
VRAALPDEQTVLAFASVVAEPTTLGAEDWSVLVRIDGRRTLGEVVAAAGCAPLVASGRIVDLMGRGLVRVRTADSDQPDEVARMLDEHDSVGGSGPVVAGAEVAPIHEVEPGPTMDAVLVEPDPFADPVGPSAHAAAEVVPATDAVEVVAEMPDAADAADVATTLAAEPGAAELVEEIPTADDWAEPVPVLLEPDPEPNPEFSFPVAVEPAAWTQGTADADAVPVAESGAPAVEWSPWAQALGLGAPAPEGELVVDPLAGPGIAEMIAEAHGVADTEHVPVPFAPVVGQEDVPAFQVGFEPGFDAVSMPAPRVPGDDTSDVATQPQAAAEPAEAAEAAAEPVPAAEDPLAGGLLAQLMTGVRGL